MSAVVLVAGQPPLSIRHHARYIALRLTEAGRVLLATSQKPSLARMLPGDVLPSTVLAHGDNGRPIWSGGLPALLGLRRRRDIAIVVWWPHASTGLLALASAVARLRGERVILDEQFRGSTDASASLALLRVLANERVVAEEGSELDDGAVRKVLAVCGGDASFAHAVLRGFSGFSETVVDRWRLRVDACISLASLMADEELRHSACVSFNVAQPMSADIGWADVVVVPHAEPWVVLADLATRTGASAVVVGHPAAGTVARSAEGAWLARLDPASILAAIERAGDAASDGTGEESVAADRLRLFGKRLLAVALRD